MPPHCDTRDGPVVKAAIKALDQENLNYVLIWVPKKAEEELRNAFERTVKARRAGREAKEVADDWFFETAIRLHRAGEGAPYTGLKPSGLDEGPVVPRAERAIETGDAKEAIDFILNTIEKDLKKRFHHVQEKKNYDVNDVDAGRAYVHAFINYVVWSHHLWAYVTEGGGHDEKENKHSEG